MNSHRGSGSGNGGLGIPMSQVHANSMAIRQEIQRFESVHPSIYALYDLIEMVIDPHVQQQMRDHVVCIEGKLNSHLLGVGVVVEPSSPSV